MTYRLTEEGRVALDFSKADYQALADDVRREVKAYFRFSRLEGAWCSKGSGSTLDSPKLYNAVRIAKRAGLAPDAEDETVGPSYGERREAFAERAAARSERRTDRATKKLATAHAVTAQGTGMMDAIPFGQPMMPDHYSYGRDRRYRERAWAKIQKGADLAKEARATFALADASKRIADGAGNESVAFAQRRVEDAEKTLRDLARRMERCNATAEAIQDGLDAGVEGDLAPYVEWAERLDAAHAEALDKLGFWLDHIEKAGGVLFSRERFRDAPPTQVYYRHGWYDFVRANAKTVTVSGWLGSPSLTWKVPYAEIASVLYDDLEA